MKMLARSTSAWLMATVLAACQQQQPHPSQNEVQFSGCSSLMPTRVHLDQRISVALNIDETLDLMVLSGERSWTVMDEDFMSDGLTLESPAKYSFAVNDLRGRYWDGSGRAVEGRVFEAPGAYELYFADNLETEPDNTLHCLIRIEVAEP
jgi:hypothetical protein